MRSSDAVIEILLLYVSRRRPVQLLASPSSSSCLGQSQAAKHSRVAVRSSGPLGFGGAIMRRASVAVS